MKDQTSPRTKVPLAGRLAGRTAVIASHSPLLRQRFPARVLTLEDGRVAGHARRGREADHVA